MILIASWYAYYMYVYHEHTGNIHGMHRLYILRLNYADNADIKFGHRGLFYDEHEYATSLQHQSVK